MALSGLRNNAVMTTETKGSSSAVQITYPAELVAAFRSLFPARKTYDFQLHSSSILAASAVGVVSGIASWNPTVSSFSEWTALAALFDECKLVEAHLTWSSMLAPTAVYLQSMVSLGPDPAGFLTSPTFTTALRLAESGEFQMGLPGKGGEATLHRVHRVPPYRVYALTSNPVSNLVDCGMNGLWAFASATATTNSLIYAYTTQRLWVRFRQRA